MKTLYAQDPRIQEYYSYVDRLFEGEEVIYNHGYLPLLIPDTGGFFKSAENLYHFMLEDIPTEGKTFLEVGCGRGEGLKSLTANNKFREVTGCDINNASIDSCKKENPLDIQFDVGDAQE